MSEIKVEASTTLCHGCLSASRRTRPPGKYSELFFNLIGSHQPYNIYNNEVMLCWECMGILRRLQSFQIQLRTAQNMLMTMLYPAMTTANDLSLSKLTTTSKENYDSEINHLDTKLEDLKKLDIDLSTEVTIVKEEADDFKDNDYVDDFDLEYMSKDEDTKDNIVIKREKKSNKSKRDKKRIKSELEQEKRRKEKSMSLTAKYEKYARVIKKGEKKNWGTSFEKHYTKVFLSEKEMEDLLSQTDRKNRSFEYTKHKCMECKLWYQRYTDLHRHNDLNHHKPNTPYRCRLCREQQPSLEHLAEHWREHSDLYRCNICAKYIRPRMLQRHLNYSHTNVYGCSGCKLEFGSLGEFAVHYKESHATFSCHDCGKVCQEKRVLIKHMAHHHGDYTCRICPHARNYRKYNKYREHLKMFHPEKMKRQEPPELSYCVECDKQYPSVYKYKKHIKESPKHTPQAPISVSCPECGKIFVRKSYMNNHYRLMHLKVTKHYCQICNKYFANSYGLRYHHNNVHLKLPKPKDKICDICGRGFHSNGVLIKHRRTHTGERPYKCAYCTASFAQITAMKTHQRTQHKESNNSIPTYITT